MPIQTLDLRRVMPLELLNYSPRGDPKGTQVCPETLRRLLNYPQAVKWATLFMANPVILLLQISSLTLKNLHYILSDLWKAARSAQVKGKIEILVWYQGSLLQPIA